MDTVTLAHAKEHLEELVERARRGEDVRIADLRGGEVRLLASGATQDGPLRKSRRLGLLEGRMTLPARLMEPTTEDELKDWYGEPE